MHLTSGRRLARNTMWNLVGNCTPVLAAIFCMPLLIRLLGTDRFGVLALAWAVVGYAGLFDLGLGRALTKVVAEKLGTGQHDDIPALVWTSLFLMLVLGLAGALVVFLFSPWLVANGLKIPQTLHLETLRSFYLLGASIPVVISIAGLRAFLEAHQRFGFVNALRIPMGVFTFVGPLTVLPFTRSLVPVVAVLVGGRLLAWLGHLLLCLYVMPALRHRVAWQGAAVGPLLRFGSWMTVSNVISPLMVTFDRFLIGAVLSVAAVAYYTTPYELVTKLWLIPGALIGVLFPAFSTSFVQDRRWVALLFGRAVRYLFVALFPIVVLIVAFAQFGLKLWLGGEFAQHSAPVLQWLAVGVFINSLAQVPFALVQGIGRPDLTAKLHLIELPAYLLGVWWLIRSWGVEGAAIAWTGRACVDALVLFGLATRFLPGGGSAIRRIASLTGIALLILAVVTFLVSPVLKGVFLCATLLGFTPAAWFLILTPEERATVQNFLKLSRVSN